MTVGKLRTETQVRSLPEVGRGWGDMETNGTEEVAAQGQSEPRGQVGVGSGPLRSLPCPQKQEGRGLVVGTAVGIAVVRGWSITGTPSGCRQGGVGLKPSVKVNQMPVVWA